MKESMGYESTEHPSIAEKTVLPVLLSCVPRSVNECVEYVHLWLSHVCGLTEPHPLAEPSLLKCFF